MCSARQLEPGQCTHTHSHTLCHLPLFSAPEQLPAARPFCFALLCTNPAAGASVVGPGGGSKRWRNSCTVCLVCCVCAGLIPQAVPPSSSSR
jgi:hypothetical protein